VSWQVRWASEDGAVPFVIIGGAAIAGVLGLAWIDQPWADSLLLEAGGELTVWVLRGAFWALDLVAVQASAVPVDVDWYSPVLNGPAVPMYALAGLVCVATLLGETIAAVVTGNTTRIVQAVFRAMFAGAMASIGGSILLSVAGGLSDLGRIALASSGASVDAPLVPLQEVLMESAQLQETGAELFVVFLAALVIVFTSLAIYFTLAMRPVLLAALIVFLPVAHALSVWTPLRRVQMRAWSIAVAVLLADAAILTMFAVTNTVAEQPQGIDRLIFGTFGLLLASLAPAALARVIGMPELHTAVQSMSRGSRAVAVGAGALALKSVLLGGAAAVASKATGRGGGAASAGGGVLTSLPAAAGASSSGGGAGSSGSTLGAAGAAPRAAAAAATTATGGSTAGQGGTARPPSSAQTSVLDRGERRPDG